MRESVFVTYNVQMKRHRIQCLVYSIMLYMSADIEDPSMEIKIINYLLPVNAVMGLVPDSFCFCIHENRW